jgi:uncharacterized protein (DUF1499 family)
MTRNRKRMLYAIAAVVVLAPVVLLAVLSATAKRPENLGVSDGRLGPCPDSPNCVCSQATDAAHRVEPIAFEGPADEALGRLKAAIGTLPRLRVVTEAGAYLHAEATSLLFRFVDDVEFYVDREAKVIHVRSASRAGRSDMGVNRARVEQIRTAFEKEPTPGRGR